MTPQHFQQQALWERFSDERLGRIASPYPWGVRHVAFDTQALAFDRLQLTSLDLRLQDGTLVDTATADPLPPARNLHDIPVTQNAVIVLVGLPLLNAEGGNCIEAERPAPRPRRFMREYLQVADLNGEGREEISVERHALALLFDFENKHEDEQNDNDKDKDKSDAKKSGDYTTCPIGRLVRNAQGRFEIDAAFVPPCLFLSASMRLTERMNRLSEILSAKSASLAVRRRERSDQIADYAVADVALFWLLHSVNSTWPDLARLCQSPDQHPERLYSVLARLAGSLLTFSTTETLKSIPQYNHSALEPMFTELESLIRNLLDTVIPSRVVPIALERPRSAIWLGKISDERLVEDADYYLSVRSSLPAHALLEQLPRLCKAGAPDEVEQIVNSALPGIPLRAMSRLPAAIPIRVENQYFALDSAHPAFKRMVAARACQFYVPASILDVSLELYAVLPT